MDTIYFFENSFTAQFSDCGMFVFSKMLMPDYF